MSVSTPSKEQRVERHLMRVRGTGKTARNLTGELFSFSICAKGQDDKATLPPAKKRKLQHKVVVSNDAETASLPRHVLKPATKLDEKPTEQLTAKARARARAAKLFDDAEPMTSRSRALRTSALSKQDSSDPAKAATVSRTESGAPANANADRAETLATLQEPAAPVHTIPTSKSSRPRSTLAVEPPANTKVARPRLPLSSISPNRERRDKRTTCEQTKTGSTTTRVPTKSSDDTAVSKAAAAKARKSQRDAAAQAYKITLKPIPTPKPRKRRLPPAEDNIDVDHPVTNIDTLTR